MARIRTIKPEFVQSETIGKMSREARLLFVQLWTIVDDAGRTRAASRMLASLLYPYDDDAPRLIDVWLQELEQLGSIRRYEVDGAQYLDIPKWLDHQKIDRPSKSRLPEYRENSTKPREGLRSLDADLGPRTVDQGPRTEDISSLRSERESDVSSETSKVPKPDDDWPSDYREQFWNAYPRRIGRKKAYAALKAIRARGEVTFAALMAGVRRIPIGKPQFIPHPTTWLNRGGWDDEPVRDDHAKPNLAELAFDLAEQARQREREAGIGRADDFVGSS